MNWEYDAARAHLPFAGAEVEVLAPGVALIATCAHPWFLTLVWDFNRDKRYVLRRESASDNGDMRYRTWMGSLYSYTERGAEPDGSVLRVVYNDGVVQHWNSDWVLVGISVRSDDAEDGEEEPRPPYEEQAPRLELHRRVVEGSAFELLAANGELVSVMPDGTVQRRLPGVIDGEPDDVEYPLVPAGLAWSMEAWNEQCGAAEQPSCDDIDWPHPRLTLLNAPPPWVTSAHGVDLATKLFDKQLYPEVGTAAVFVTPPDQSQWDEEMLPGGRGIEAASWVLPAVIVRRELGPAEPNEDGTLYIPCETIATQGAVVRNMLFLGSMTDPLLLDQVEIEDTSERSPEDFEGMTISPHALPGEEAPKIYLWVARRFGGLQAMYPVQALQAVARSGVNETTWFRDWTDLWNACMPPAVDTAAHEQ